MWIAVFLPNLPLDLAYRRWPDALQESLRHEVPLAIVEGKRIRWVSPRAAEAGVLVGMTESGGHALASNLMLLPRDHDAEAAAAIEAALWALHFTPQVSIRPSGLLLDVTASLRLFGGARAIMDALRSGMAALGFEPHIAAAPTATAAWWLAQTNDGMEVDADSLAPTVEQMPALLMETLQPYAETLEAVGCRTLGQVRRLPRNGITKRFGRSVLQELDRAFGSEPELMNWYEPPEQFSRRIELAGRVETTELLLVAAKRLLMQMTGYLAARHAAVSRFGLLLHHEKVRNGKSPTTRVDIALGAPSRDLDHLSLLVKEHLAKVALSSSVIELTLEAGAIESLGATNTELFPTPASESESVGRLVERLASRLGADAIKRLRVVADHRPERSTSLTRVEHAPRKSTGSRAAVVFPPRPTWLLDQPIPLLTRQNKPFYQSPLQLINGPERIETGWWDDSVISRDYFVAANEAHQLLWIYRERISAADEEPGWFLHGFYA